MTQPDLASSMSAEETLLLIEGWLRAEPSLSFKRVRSDARNLNVSVTARQYSEAKKRLGITAAPPRPASRTQSSDMNDSDAAPRTPLMSFVVEFLRGKPDASYQDVRAAGEAASFQVAPINYGNARRMLGLAPKVRRSANPRRRRLRQVDEDSELSGAAPATARGRRGRKRKVDFSNLSNLVTELQDVVAERDRILAALDQIADIIRHV